MLLTWFFCTLSTCLGGWLRHLFILTTGIKYESLPSPDRNAGSAVRTKQWHVSWSGDMYSHSSSSSGKYIRHSGRRMWSVQCHGACKEAFKEKFSVSILLISFICLKLEVEESALGWPKARLSVFTCTEHAQPLGLSSLLLSISVSQKCLQGEFQVVFTTLSVPDIYSSVPQDNCY